ncbi:zinc ABC transporter substrate-binding protein, partial [bacterium]|nr:zinc ABC transporter substrate-binding protein [bacterium]
AWLVERLAGEAFALEVALAPGESPATYDPTPRRLAELSATRLYLSVGVPLERILIPRLRDGCRDLIVADLSAGVELLAGDDHGHGHECDPHVWLSPRRMRVMAATAAAALGDLRPELAGTLATNLARLQAELDVLDGAVAELLAPAAGRTMVVFHPAFGYLAHDYGFVQKAIEKDGLPPSPRHLAAVLAEIRDQRINTVFVQPQSASAQLQAVAAAEGLAVAVLDPLAYDYADNLLRMAARIGAALSTSTAKDVSP